MSDLDDDLERTIMNITIEIRIPALMADEEDSTGVTADTYDLIMDSLSWAESISIYKTY